MLYLKQMDKELEKRWQQLPKVEVERSESMLVVNDRFVSLPDITPEVLSDYIEIGHDTIHSYLSEMRKSYRYWGEPKMRSSLLIGRLALSTNEETVFTPEGLQAKSEDDLVVDTVVQEYREYWSVITQSLYVPVVRRNVTLHNSNLDGTWLSIRRP